MTVARPVHPTIFYELSLLYQKYHFHTMYIFGSRQEELNDWLAEPTKPLSTSASDIDISVRSLNSRPVTVSEKVRLTHKLETLFQDQRVDLVLLDEADPFLAVNIIRGLRPFTVDNYAADEYELYILRRAADLAPFERIRQAKILNPTS